MDFDFSGFGDFEAKAENIEIKKTKKYDRIWRTGKDGGSIDNNPLLIEGFIYFGALDGYVYAVDKNTGQVIWSIKTEDRINGSSPVQFERNILIGSYDGGMYSINIDMRSIEWIFKANAEIFSSPYVYEGRVYFGSKDSYMYCLDAKTGKEIWRFKSGADIATAPLAEEGRVYFGSYDHYFYCLNADNGKELWRFKTGNDLISNFPYVTHKGLIFFGSFDGFIYAVDKINGNERWRFKAGKYGVAGGIPLVHKGVLYFSSRDGDFYALNIEGRVLWRFKADSPLIAQYPQIYKNTIFFSDERGDIYFLDMNGQEVARYRVGDMMYGKFVLDNGKLYVGSWDARFYCINLDTMTEVWRLNTFGASRSEIPPVHEVFEASIKTSTETIDSIVETDEKYSGSMETLNLSDYGAKSEYMAKSEYTNKSEYTTDFVIFEGAMNFGNEGMFIPRNTFSGLIAERCVYGF